jgi:hypothetical protein
VVTVLDGAGRVAVRMVVVVTTVGVGGSLFAVSPFFEQAARKRRVSQRMSNSYTPESASYSLAKWRL